MAKVQINPSTAQTRGGVRPNRLSGLRFGLGMLFILVSVAASLTLVLEHVGSVSAPGCGIGGACERAANSFWGGVRMGETRWPTSFIGFAYFLAAMLGWATCRNGVPGAFRALVRIGAAVSTFFLVVIVVGRHFCPYCLASHACMLLFWLTVETADRSPRHGGAVLAMFGAVLAITSGVLAGIEMPRQRAAARLAREQREESIRAVNAKNEEDRNRMAASAPATGPTTTPTSAPAATGKPFTGRYRLGPEDAPIRIVIISDFQCPDCQQVEAQVRAVMGGRNDISISAKHFPMCPECNAFMNGQRMHDNACWAARAAEAAGILGGNDGFWRMHHWLFDNKGFFEKPDIEAALPGLGFDVAQFLQVMQSEDTMDLVRADVEEAHGLGLFFTPMIFINGVEVRGFIRQPNAIKQAVEAVASHNPPRGTAALDHPDNAAQKCVGDWRAQFLRPMPKTTHTWSQGPQDAKVAVDVWSDHAFKLTAELESVIREQAKAGIPIRYTFHEYPANHDCNPHIPVAKSGSPNGCWAAAAAEAAGRLGGNDAFWKVHGWLVGNQTKLNDAELLKAAPLLGLDGPTLIATIAAPEVQAAIREDVTLGEPYIMQGIPTIYVNGRWVPRWRLEGEPILKMIIEEAARQ